MSVNAPLFDSPVDLLFGAAFAQAEHSTRLTAPIDNKYRGSGARLLSPVTIDAAAARSKASKLDEVIWANIYSCRLQVIERGKAIRCELEDFATNLSRSFWPEQRAAVTISHKSGIR